jgi:hypothetical protein
MKANEASVEPGIRQNILSRSVGRLLEWQAGAALKRIRRQLGTQGMEASEEEAGK